MILIGVLLALALERLVGHWPGMGEAHLLRRFAVGAQRAVPAPQFWRLPFAPALLLIAGVLAAALLANLVERPLARLAVDTLLLFLCLGPRDLADDIHRLLAARASGDAAAEEVLTRALLRGPDQRASKRALLGALFVQSHERLFGVLLWFFVFGGVGAVFYRLASRLPRQLHESQPDTPAESTAVTLHAAAAWVSARITALLYGMAGSYDDAIAAWRRVAAAGTLEWRARTWAVLAEVGAGSLNAEEGDSGPLMPATLDECLREVLRMQRRALLVLLAFFAVFTLGGYIV